MVRKIKASLKYFDTRTLLKIVPLEVAEITAVVLKFPAVPTRPLRLMKSGSRLFFLFGKIVINQIVKLLCCWLRMKNCSLVKKHTSVSIVLSWAAILRFNSCSVVSFLNIFFFFNFFFFWFLFFFFFFFKFRSRK